jgi:hypothetical protein
VTLVLAAVATFLVGLLASRGQFELKPLPGALLVCGVAAVYFSMSTLGFGQRATLGLAAESVAIGLILFVVPLLGHRLRRRLDQQRV